MVQAKEDFDGIALRLGNVFKPSAPIKKEELFQGRTTQIREVVDAINQSGKHVVLYGEAGVGKTSLGQILKTKLRALENVPIISPLVTCDSSDDYTSMWYKMLEQIKEDYPDASIFESGSETESESHSADGDDEVEAGEVPDGLHLMPSDIRKQIAPLAAHGIAYIIFDEFDKIRAQDMRRLMADTIKLFSDREVNVTIILIGVAESVTGLIDDHHSIERCLAQVHMPRLPFAERAAIVTKGLTLVGMSIKDDALDEIAGLSKGLPHYTHLLALNAGQCALDDKKLEVAAHHVDSALKAAIGQANESIRTKYDEATYSTKKNTLHVPVLLACALADCDEFGYFQPGDVIDPLSTIEDRDFTTDRFTTHLKKFCDINVLYRTGGEYRWRYHFVNPLMQPYVIMKGLDSGMISKEKINLSEIKYPLFTPTKIYVGFAAHLFAAAFLAMALHFAGDSFAALALPPFSPPNRPSATAAGFFPSSGLAFGGSASGATTSRT